MCAAGNHRLTLRLFADIDMLVQGEHFFGLLNSNLVRMIYRLRFPDVGTFHGLAQHITDLDFRTRPDSLEY